MNKKILIVEDDRIIGTMYETKLKQDGYIIFLAETGPQGFDKAIKERPDLILLDVILPQMDGFQVLQELKLNKLSREIPVVMLTNLGTTEDRQKGEQLGAIEYLVKANLTPEQVRQTIKKYLE